MYKDLRKIFVLYSRKDKVELSKIAILTILMGIFDMLGIASIMPFMMMLMNPSSIFENEFLNLLYVFLGFSSVDKFLIFLGFGVFIFLIFTLFLRTLTSFLQLRYAAIMEVNISSKILHSYLGQNYEWFLTKNSAELSKNILSEVNLVVNNGLLPAINLLAQIAVSSAILLLLMIVDYELALSVGMLLSGIYLSIFFLSRKYISSIGEKRFKVNKQRFSIVSEIFGGIKEIKILGIEDKLKDRYKNPTKSFAKYQATAVIAAQLPRYLLEAVAFGGMMVVILYLMVLTNSDINQAIPVLSLYALAAYRLIPSFQQIYASFTKLNFSNSAIEKLHEEVREIDFQKRKLNLPEKESSLNLKEFICLKEVQFSYPSAMSKTVNIENLKIDANTRVGIVGPTGSGKTTLVDIILGLIVPKIGSIYIDDLKLN